MPKIDLHIHSNCSGDGEFPVETIMGMCKQVSLDYISITDHNTVRGVSPALAFAPKMGIQVIPGVELDCVHNGKNLHLLGYHFDFTHPAFQTIEQDILEQEKKFAAQKIELIQKELGIPIQANEILSAAHGGIVTGELIAEILLNKKDAKNHDVLHPYLSGGSRSDNPYVNFYWDYFSQGKPAYIPIRYISLRDGVSLIHAAGGIAVLAHPGQNLKRDYAFLEQIISEGIDGIETYSSYHSSADAAFFTRIAEENNLLVTCGSDFHGKTKPSISLCGHGAEEKMPAFITALRGIILT